LASIQCWRIYAGVAFEKRAARPLNAVLWLILKL